MGLPFAKEGFIVFSLTIEDHGWGIPADKLDSLFINFCKIDEHRLQNPSGVGLGLSICKDLLESMGGSVAVESTVGVGTKFIITFKTKCEFLQGPSPLNIATHLPLFLGLASPIDEEYLTDNTSEQSLNSPFEESNDAVSNFRCLISNDEPFILLTASSIASKYFSAVVTTENGLEALQEVQRHPLSYFDVIILDINMPVMGGVETCEKIHAYFNKLIVWGQTSASRSQSSSPASEQLARQPAIYAVTADCCPANILQYRALFTDVFDVLSEGNLKQIISKLSVRPQLEELKVHSEDSSESNNL